MFKYVVLNIVDDPIDQNKSLTQFCENLECSLFPETRQYYNICVNTKVLLPIGANSGLRKSFVFEKLFIVAVVSLRNDV